ncbi:riboflavin synthase [Teichococcus aestuarii]
MARDERRFTVEVSAETLGKTTLGQWRQGGTINLERALKMGDEMGGHVVSGHVDGVGEVVSATPENGSLRLVVKLPEALARFVAPKGSVTIEGVSLTVNDVEGSRFGVNLIPHTAQVTTLGGLRPGAPVNIEIDMLARYVARLREFEAGDARRGRPRHEYSDPAHLLLGVPQPHRGAAGGGPARPHVHPRR